MVFLSNLQSGAVLNGSFNFFQFETEGTYEIDYGAKNTVGFRVLGSKVYPSLLK